METKSKDKTIGRTARHLLATFQPPRRLIAGELAIRMANAVEADQTMRQEIVVCAMCIGQWLSDQGTAGRWDLLAPAAVLRAMGPLSPHDESIFLHNLAGLVIHACLAEGITPEDARRILEQLPRLTNDQDLKHSLRMILKNLNYHLRSRLGH
jgi:hypothetical protein